MNRRTRRSQRDGAAAKNYEPRISRIPRIKKTFQRKVAKTQRGPPQPKELVH